MVSTDWLLRHRRAKGAATGRSSANGSRVCPLLYPELMPPKLGLGTEGCRLQSLELRLFQWASISVLVVCLCSFTACTAKPRLWLVDSIADAGLGAPDAYSEQVTLKLPDNTVAASVNRSDVKSLALIHANLDEIAQAHSVLYLTNRGAPYRNAYAATIDGVHIIAVNTQMLALLGSSRGMYAALIAHELAHLVKKHKSADAWINSVIFNKNQEAEADAYGIRLMHQAGYDLTGVLEFYKKLIQASGGAISFFSAHPGDKERLQHVKGVITSFHEE